MGVRNADAVFVGGGLHGDIGLGKFLKGQIVARGQNGLCFGIIADVGKAQIHGLKAHALGPFQRGLGVCQRKPAGGLCSYF